MLREQVTVSITRIQPRDEDTTGAIDDQFGPRLPACQCAYRGSIGGPLRNAGGVDASRIDVPVGATARVLPGDDRARRPIRDQGGSRLRIDGVADSDATRGPYDGAVRVHTLRVDIFGSVAGIAPRNDGAPRTIWNDMRILLISGRGADGDAIRCPHHIPR